MVDKKEFEQKLREAITDLEKQIEMAQGMTQPVGPDSAIGRVSRMDAIVNKGVAEAGLRNLQQRLAGLQKALVNLPREDFGLCARCKKPIPEKRLLLMPHSPYCVNCSA